MASKLEMGSQRSHDDAWTCIRCTLINSRDTRRCLACGGKRPPENTVHRKDGDKAGQSITGLKGQIHKQFYAKSRPGTASIRAGVVQQEHDDTAVQDWSKIIKECQRNKNLFEDDVFPPAASSLFKDPQNPPQKYSTGIPQWRRPKDVRSSSNDKHIPWTVFRTPRPSDICQGQLGNCWFLSALAILAERPELVERIIVTKEICNAGVYQVRLCKDGQWKTILLDDNFPCYEDGRMVYSRGRRKQLWVSLIEKAFAKLHGSYEALAAGRNIEALAALTGAPCTKIFLQQKRQEDEIPIDYQIIWAKLVSNKESNFLMGASCGSRRETVDKDYYKQLGLVANHAYSLLDVRECDGNLLVRLRNPWGKFSWSGEWSDNSEAWKTISSSKKDDLMPYGNDEGIFWMSLKDFMRYFYVVEVCKYTPDLMEIRFNGTIPNNACDKLTVYHLEVFDTSEIEIGLFQKGVRGTDKTTQDPVDLCVQVFKLENVVEQSVGKFEGYSQRQVRSFIGCTLMLKQGQYVIVCSAFNHYGKTLQKLPKYALAIHSIKPIIVTPRDGSEYTLADSLIQLAIPVGEIKKQTDDYSIYSVCTGWEGIYLMVENRSHKKAVHIEFDFTKSTSVVSTRSALVTADSVPPLHRQVVQLISSTSKSYRLQYHWKVTQRCVGVGLGDEIAPDAPDAFHQPAIISDVRGLHEPRKLL